MNQTNTGKCSYIADSSLVFGASAIFQIIAHRILGEDIIII